MFTLFALLKDEDGLITPDSLIRDLVEKFAWIGEFRIEKEELSFPQTTRVVLHKPDWQVCFDIRSREEMTLDTGRLHEILAPKAALPADFLAYDTEMAIGFGDDPDRLYTDEVIFIGEFVRENYPGVVIFDQYNQDVW